MRHSPYNRYERKQIQQEKLAQSLAGSGLFVYKNPSRTGTLTLPKPTDTGKRMIGPMEEFQGDSYFMALVRTNDLIKVRTLVSIEQHKANAIAAEQAKLALAAPPAPKVEVSVVKTVTEEHVLSEATEERPKTKPTRKVETVTTTKTSTQQRKLVLDQPDQITNEGKVEHVVREDGVQKLHDHAGKSIPQDVLLNEHPAGEIIIE